MKSCPSLLLGRAVSTIERERLPFHPFVAQAVLLLVAAFTGVLPLNAQLLPVESAEVRSDGTFQVVFPTTAENYYVLMRGDPNFTNFDTPRDIRTGVDGFGSLQSVTTAGSVREFFQVMSVPIGAPLDLDADGIDDVFELNHPEFLSPFDPFDAARDFDRDGDSNLKEYQDGTRLDDPPLLFVSSTSPNRGEGGVAVTREVVIRFSRPLKAGSIVTSENLFATFGGERIEARLHLGADLQSASLYFDDPLPGDSNIDVTFLGEGLFAEDDTPIDADGDGEAGGSVAFTFSTL